MANLLQINSSLFEDHGVSSSLADRLVSRLRSAHPGLAVTRRDLARDPLPHFDAGILNALSTPPADRTAEQARVVAEADALIAEVQAANVLVLGVAVQSEAVPVSVAMNKHVISVRPDDAHATVASLMPTTQLSQPVAQEPKPAPTKGGGYHLSEHVKRYFKTTLI